MILIHALAAERLHAHEAPELIPHESARPMRAWRVSMLCESAAHGTGSGRGDLVSVSECSDAQTLAEAVRRAQNSAHWRGLVPVAITYAGELK